MYRVEPPKLGIDGATLPLDGECSWPKKTLPICLPRRIWWFCVKNVCKNREDTPKLGNTKAPFWDGGVADL